jgi:hypothetical protein
MLLNLRVLEPWSPVSHQNENDLFLFHALSHTRFTKSSRCPTAIDERGQTADTKMEVQAGAIKIQSTTVLLPHGARCSERTCQTM